MAAWPPTRFAEKSAERPMRAAGRPGTLNPSSIVGDGPVATRVPIRQGSPIMTSLSPRTAITRRTALSAAGAGGLGLALAAAARPAAAQDASGDLAGHPLVGTWLVMTPDGVV